MAIEPGIDKEKYLAGLQLAKPFISIGVDIGKMVDPSTVVVSEAVQRFSGRWRHIPEDFSPRGYTKAQDIPILETVFNVRFVSRIPLGTPYPAVALMLARLLDSEPLQHKRRVMRVDITGVGRPVYDSLVVEVKRMPERKLIHTEGISLAYGDNYNKTTGVLGKKFAVSRAQVLLQNGLIKVSPNQPEALAMCEELKIYKIKINTKAHETFGAFETGTHDDLATGLILSVLEDAIANTVTIGPKIR